MIEIRALTLEDMQETIDLKIQCWPEELAGRSNFRFDTADEFQFWTHWMVTENENNDIRRLYGAFDKGQMLGVAFASFVEDKDHPESGFELNGLWVYPQYRGRGVSMMLLTRLLDDFETLGADKVIVYNFHHSSSNAFYRSLGFQVIDTELQLKEQVPVDIFFCSASSLREAIGKKLIKYSG